MGRKLFTLELKHLSGPKAMSLTRSTVRNRTSRLIRIIEASLLLAELIQASLWR